MREPDPQALAAARRGDPRAFEQLVVAYQADVWRLALLLVRDRTTAEDVVQETFVRVLRFLPRFRGDSRFSTWLFSITRNCARDAMRAAARDTRLAHRLGPPPAGATNDETVRFDLKQAIASLPLELREPLVLIDLFELSYAEAGRVLVVPQGTVKSRVYRARQILIDALGPGLERIEDEKA